MASGLFALLDDVAAIAKIAATSLDDMAAAAGRASTKAAGVVIDDAAVTPRYVTGFTPDRELPIIGKIALGSLKNKLLFLLPAALLLSAFVPWAITPLLMLGGAFLCYEGAEKALEAMGYGHHHAEETAGEDQDPFSMEQEKVSGAIRTDLILSAEILAIALADIASEPFWTRAIVLTIVSLAVTVGVYGFVAVIVKMDDIGFHLAKEKTGALARLGDGLVHAMPRLLAFLSIVGMAAMLWVGGGIILHGMHELHIGGALYDAIHHAADGAASAVAAVGSTLNAVLSWLLNAAAAGVVGLIVGLAVIGGLKLVPKRG